MKPPLPRIETAVPRLPHVQLEIAKAIRTLMGPDEGELAWARRTEIAAIRHDFEVLTRDIPKAFAEASTMAQAELRSLRLAKKYNPDEPRVPASYLGGGRWMSEDGGDSTPSRNTRYAANGTFPPALPGYDPKTWKQGQWPTGRYWVESPNRRKFTAHPEDDQHWRHWDIGDGDDDGYDDQERWPANSLKPRANQKRLRPEQSVTDPNGDEPPWTPNPLTPIVPDPILPLRPIPVEPMFDFPAVIFPG